MKLKELTFCSATIITKVDYSVLNKIVENVDELVIKKTNTTDEVLSKSLFFTLEDLLELKDSEQLFKIVYKLILLEENKLDKLFKTTESFNNLKNMDRYFEKKGNVELKFLALCYHYLKLNKFEDFSEEDCGITHRLFSDLYIKLSKRIILDSFKISMNVNSSNCERKDGAEEMVDFEKVSKSLYNDLKNVKESNVSLTLENKSLTKLNKSYIKQIDKLNKEILDTKNYIQNNIQKTMEENNKVLIDTFKHLKYDVLDNTYSATLDKLTNELSQAKADNKILLQKNSTLSKKKLELEENINSYEIIQNQEIKVEEESANKDTEIKLENKKDTTQYNNYFINSHIVWIKDVENMIGMKSDGSEIEIVDVPIITYFNKGDFILVSKGGKFLRNLDGYTDREIYPSIKFAMVIERDDKLYACRDITGEMIELNLSNVKIPPKQNMIVGLDVKNKYNIKIIFKRCLHNLDSYEAIIKMKQQKIFYILKTLSKGYLVRDCFNNIESFVNMYIKDVEGGDLIIVDKDDNYLGMLPPALYLNSTLNSYKEYYTISIQNDVVYGIHKNGNMIKLSNPINMDVKDNDLAVVDEFNNILYLADCETKEKLTPKFKKRARNSVVVTKDIDCLGDILIVGDIGYSENYKNSFENIYYKTTTLDGFGSYSQISFNIKKYNYIICVVSHCSHDNMWRLKDEGLDNIIFANGDGANQLVNELNNFMK